MNNTLRQYHLGCGERLQTFYTWVLKTGSAHQQRIARLQGKPADKQSKKQY